MDVLARVGSQKTLTSLASSPTTGPEARFQPLRPAALCLLSALVLAGLAGRAPAIPEPQADLITGKDTPVAATTEKTITAAELVERIKNTGFRGELTWQNLGQFGASRLNSFLERSLSDQVLAKRAAEDKDWQRPASIDTDVAQLREKLLMQQLYQTVVLDKATTPSEEALLKFYDEHKQNYHVPFNFAMRHLYLSAYEDYTVNPGDTLTDIAQNVTGDKQAASRILLKATKRSPGEKEEEEGKERKPGAEPEVDVNVQLEPGTELLVPMPDARALKVKEQVFEYYKQLKEGADFQELAAQHSQAASGGDQVNITPSRERPMLPDIIDVVKKTPIGSFSEPFQTKHGWQIIQVVRRNEESTRPFESVKKAIQTEVERQLRQEAAEAFINEAFERSKALILNPKALQENADPDTIVAKVGDFTYSRRSMLIDMPDKVKPDLSLKELREALKANSMIQREVLTIEAEKMGLADKPEVKAVLEQTESGLVAQNYLSDILQAKLGNIPEAEQKTFFEENQDQFKTPRKLDLYAIAVQVDSGGKTGLEDINKARQEASKQLEAWKEEIRTLDDFQKIAREHSVIKPEEAGHIGEVTSEYLNGMNGTLGSMKVKEVTGPVGMPDRMYLLWAESETPAAVPPFDDVKNKVIEAYGRKMRSEWEKRQRQEILDSLGYKFLLPLDEKGEEG